MRIYIPTRGRASYQLTYKNLPVHIREQVIFIVDSNTEAAILSRHFIIPPRILITNGVRVGIGPARDTAIADALMNGENCLMMDDDLTFAMRRGDYPTKFKPPVPNEITNAILEMEHQLNYYAMVAMSHREGANRRTEPWIQNTRALRVLGYNTRILAAEGIKFSDMEFMEDFHVQLALLTRGYETGHLNWMVHNQPGSNTLGGCSEYRTLERQKLAAEALKAKYPDFVDVVVKQTKTSWKGETRHDVRIKWAAAYESARKKQTVEILDGGAGEDPDKEGGLGTAAME
jgi:hypothetical protein